MTTMTTPFDVRDYRPADEPSWLRCRVLSFLGTQYYDDVRTTRAPLGPPSVELVAVDDRDEVIGILDIELEGDLATIDTIATHPDHERLGIATRLLQTALPLLRARRVRTLDAWTREDAAANRWYARNGFVEQHRYLHVYLGYDDDPEGFTAPAPLTKPVTAFSHGPIEHEAQLRARYPRVHVCRRYVRPLH